MNQEQYFLCAILEKLKMSNSKTGNFSTAMSKGKMTNRLSYKSVKNYSKEEEEVEGKKSSKQGYKSWQITTTRLNVENKIHQSFVRKPVVIKTTVIQLP